MKTEKQRDVERNLSQIHKKKSNEKLCWVFTKYASACNLTFFFIFDETLSVFWCVSKPKSINGEVRREKELINILNFPFIKMYLTHGEKRSEKSARFIMNCWLPLTTFYISSCCFLLSLPHSPSPSRRPDKTENRPNSLCLWQKPSFAFWKWTVKSCQIFLLSFFSSDIENALLNRLLKSAVTAESPLKMSPDKEKDRERSFEATFHDSRFKAFSSSHNQKLWIITEKKTTEKKLPKIALTLFQANEGNVGIGCGASFEL